MTPRCPRCEKPTPRLCVCDAIPALKPRLKVLVLQHPQEPREALGTAKIATLALAGSELRVGLSWANLKRALGHEADPKRWAVLYLGSGVKTESGEPVKLKPGTLTWVNKKGRQVAGGAAGLEGLLVLDGTWSQAKALWWRNAWLLKLPRLVLEPGKPSLYGKLRREPRPECVSTLEGIAEALTLLGEKPSVETGLRALFATLVERAAARAPAGAGPPTSSSASSPADPSPA